MDPTPLTTTPASDRPMRILVIAYEFPPSPSPQSLRWAYLSRELDRLGHEIHVLTIDLGGSAPGLPVLPMGITVHRTYPGPVRGLVAMRRRYRERTNAPAPAPVPAATAPSRGGWKHRISAALQRVGEHLWFPDLRGEWHVRARRRMDELLAQLQPDMVISSHEPATTLQLGLRAKESGFAWIADLADPVLAPYTLPRWKEKARRLEADVCNLADHVLVTTPSARRLLLDRHAGSAPITVLTQGFDDSECHPGFHVDTDPDRLELLYTGSFYRFRTVDVLLRAVLETPGIRLNVATIHVPDELLAASRQYPRQIRLLGFLPHLQALAWQRAADVLVNLANSDPTQVPGKCYEYMGAGRPILHLGDDADDAVAAEIRARDRGWVCPSESAEVVAKLRELVRKRSEGRLDEGLSLEREGVSEFGWGRLAGQLEQVARDCFLPRNP